MNADEHRSACRQAGTNQYFTNIRVHLRSSVPGGKQQDRPLRIMCRYDRYAEVTAAAAIAWECLRSLLHVVAEKAAKTRRVLATRNRDRRGNGYFAGSSSLSAVLSIWRGKAAPTSDRS